MSVRTGHGAGRQLAPAGCFRLLAGGLCLSLFLAPGPLHAGGVQLTERGTRPLGRGGAAVVATDDLDAAYLNPAALTRSPGRTAQLGTALLDFSLEFDRTPDPRSGVAGCCEPVSSRIVYANPMIGLGYGADDGAWVVAFSAFGPYAGAAELPEDGASRYVITDQANALAYVQLSGAARLLPWMHLGIGLQLRQFRMFQQFVGSVYPGFVGAPEDPELDVLLDVRVDDWYSPGAVAGVLLTPLPSVELAFVYQTPFHVSGEGTLRARMPSHYMFSQVEQQGDYLRLETNLPDIFRLGVRYVDSGSFDVEADVVWERWSQHTDITATPLEPIRFTGVPGIGEYEVGRIFLDESFVDTWSFRLGGELHLLDGLLRVRAGTFVENGAVPDETLSVGAFDTDKLGLAAGVTLRWGQLDVDLGMMHVFMRDRHVTNSRRRQINPLYPDTGSVQGPTVVGNGDYDGRLDIIVGSLLLHY